MSINRLATDFYKYMPNSINPESTINNFMGTYFFKLKHEELKK